MSAAAADAKAPAAAPAPAGSRLHGAIFAAYMLLTPLFACVFLMVPALVLLLPFGPYRAARVRLYQTWIGSIMSLWLRLPVAILEVRGMTISFSGDYQPSAGTERQSFVMISNHPTRIDWLVLWSWWVRFGALDVQRIALKYGLKLIPGSGWAMQLASFLFLRRAWADDKRHITRWVNSQFVHTTNSAATTSQVLLFPEGTNITAETIGIDRKFVAKTPGLTPYTHVLHPRTTGFVHLINEIRAASASASASAAAGSSPFAVIDTVYDVTLTYPDARSWTEADLVAGRVPPHCHMHFKNYRLTELPVGDAELAEWCNARFAEKELRIAEFRANPPQLTHAVTPTVHYLGVIVFWSVLTLALSSLLVVSSAARWYALIACVGSFLFNKYGAGFDTAMIDWVSPAPAAVNKQL